MLVLDEATSALEDIAQKLIICSTWVFSRKKTANMVVRFLATVK